MPHCSIEAIGNGQLVLPLNFSWFQSTLALFHMHFEWNNGMEYRLRIHYFFSHIFNSLKNHRFHSGLESNNNNNSAFDLQCQTNYSFIECVLSVLHHLRFITPEPNWRQSERAKKCECIQRIQCPNWHLIKFSTLFPRSLCPIPLFLHSCSASVHCNGISRSCPFRCDSSSFHRFVDLLSWINRHHH